MRRKLVLVLSLLGLTASLAWTARPAQGVPYGITVVPTQALVDRLGGITISGTSDCTTEVRAAFPGGIPDKLTVAVGVNWTAYQPAGRRTMIHASFAANMAKPCYNRYAAFGPRCGGGAGPCPWITSNYSSGDTPFYVYSLDGKFVRGWVHVDVEVEGGAVFFDGVYQESLSEAFRDMFTLAGYNVRAVRAPRP